MIDDELTQVQLFDVFSNARRRQTVRYLREQNGSCDLAPLVEQVAAWENDVDPADVTRAQRRRVYISLYQTHLPMLEDHGIVDWNPDAHTIELLPNQDLFDPYLDQDLETDRPWHVVYSGLSVGGAAVLVLSWLSVGPLTAELAPIAVLVLCGLVFLTAATEHLSGRPNVRRSIPVLRS